MDNEFKVESRVDKDMVLEDRWRAYVKVSCGDNVRHASQTFSTISSARDWADSIANVLNTAYEVMTYNKMGIKKNNDL